MSDKIPMLDLNHDFTQESDLSLADIMNRLTEQYAMCRNEMSSATRDIWHRIEVISKEIVRRS